MKRAHSRLTNVRESRPFRSLVRSRASCVRRDAFGARHAGIPLAAERAAMPRAEANSQVNRRLLSLHLPEPLLAIRMREIR